MMDITMPILAKMLRDEMERTHAEFRYICSLPPVKNPAPRLEWAGRVVVGNPPNIATTPYRQNDLHGDKEKGKAS